MPYRSVRELPPAVRDNLPKEAAQQFLRVANSVLAKGGNDESAFKQAWGVIKKRWEKNADGKWVKKKEAMSEDLKFAVPLSESEDGWYLFFPLRKIFHYRREFDMTADRAASAIETFHGGVPEYRLPVNGLHDDSIGVFAFVDDLRLSDRGVEWKPEWREGKKEEARNKGWNYISPEVVFDGYQATDGREFDTPVFVGAALTPRPRLGRDTAVFSEETGEWETAGNVDIIREIVEELGNRILDFFAERGEGQGQGGPRQGDGGPDKCVCPECGKTFPHKKDSPCNESKCPDCGVALKPQKKGDMSEFDEAASKAQKARSSRYGIAILPQGHVTKPAKWEKLSDDQFADPVNYRYPVHDEAHARNAASRFAQEEDTGYKGRGVVAKRIDAAKRKFKIGEHKEDKRNMSEQDINATQVESVLDRFRNMFKADEDEKAEFETQLEELKTQLSDAEAAKEAEITALSEQLADEKKAKEAAEEQVREFNEKLALEEKARRLAEFSEKAKELRVPVQHEEFAEALMLLHDSDDSEDKTHYNRVVSVIEAMGNAEKMAALFAEAGHDNADTEPEARMDKLIKERMKEFSENIGEATTAVAHEHPELYAEYNKATVKSVNRAAAS